MKPFQVDKDAAIETARRVLEAEAESIRRLKDRIGEDFLRAVSLAAACNGKIAVIGLGKSGIICQKIAATLSSTGTPAIFLHAADALHGDCGILTPDDLAIVISKSGETAEIIGILDVVKRLSLPIIALSGNPDSTLSRYADVCLDVSVTEEAGPLGLAPTSSTAAALAMGDALAMALMECRKFGREDFASVHPAGSLGKKLLCVADLMHGGDRIPRVLHDAVMSGVIYEMSSKGLGMTAVTDARNVVLGVISDGDLRRLLEKSPDPLRFTAEQVMSTNPKTIGGGELAASALAMMEAMKITSLVVVDDARRVTGVIHIHDLWRTGLF
ncbi:MAG: KpsF/GutQ family sugar-phosphate isomerase [Acidobacteriota bacterium]|jgi:arabinose-5-phosphate isomerase|nr:KpsF/GutQ family sugar-phosphate isomerase [Acidobacteriota bacterium]